MAGSAIGGVKSGQTIGAGDGKGCGAHAPKILEKFFGQYINYYHM